MKKILIITVLVVVIGISFYLYYSSSPQVLKSGKVGVWYSELAYHCGPGSEFPITKGSLPPGIKTYWVEGGTAYEDQRVSLHGTPTQAGEYAFTISGMCHVVIKISN